MRKIKWGVIGSGGIARRRTIPEGFVPAQNAHLVAVYGTNSRTNKEVARQFGVLQTDSLEALLAADIEAVYIASPVQAHLPQVLACAQARKHVLCEKPLGRNLPEAEQMAQACRDQQVQFGTAFMMRFHPQHQAAAEMIRQGKIGQPVYARAQLSCWYPEIPGAWRQNPELSGGGSLMDLGSHCLDLLEMFFGPVRKVSCFIGRTIQSYASEDSAVGLLEFANGALGSVDVFFCIQDDSSKNALELYGSAGSILARGTIGQSSEGEMTAYLQPQAAGYQAQQVRSAAAGLELKPSPRNIYRAEIEAFSDALLQGTDNPLGGELGLRSQKLLTACYDSARQGRAIEIV